jgi:hypothetical protein
MRGLTRALCILPGYLPDLLPGFSPDISGLYPGGLSGFNPGKFLSSPNNPKHIYDHINHLKNYIKN